MNRMKDTFSSCVPLCCTPPDGLEIVQHCGPSAPVKWWNQDSKWYGTGTSGDMESRQW